MSSKITVKGQVTLPKSVREAAGIRPGDLVDVRLGPGGGIVVEKATPTRVAIEAVERRFDKAMAELDRLGVRPDLTTDEFMRMLRGDD
ncbi:MAG: AbrB family transcriptional regulator [Methylocystaceae bacterium]|nr:MAG: AbrB family transcriptional regulator [Methylocystaceae bacterium]